MTDEERQKLVARLRAHEVVMWTDIDLAADEIERLEKELANANRLLEINRRRSLEKSGGLEIKQSDAEPSLSDQMYGFHGAGFNSTTSDAEPVAQKKLEEATTYAEQLAISLAARWYPEVPQWRPLRDDLIGLLTQIDNMSTGAVRAQSDAEPLAKHPLGPDDKPMTDWYYDDDGVCRPLPSTLATRNPAPDAAAGGPTPSKTITIGGAAPPRPGASAGLIEAAAIAGLAKARTIALEQRCERGTPWDLACVTIANKIGEQCGYPPIPTDAWRDDND